MDGPLPAGFSEDNSMVLKLRNYVNLPPHSSGGFDHADVHNSSGRVFVAHTATGGVDIIGGEPLIHLTTIPGCPEGSGFLCAQDEGLVFAAARGGGKILVIEAVSMTLLHDVAAGSKPNGLAWDSRRKQLLVTDVKDFQGRLLDPFSRNVLAKVTLPGRPRWCIYDRTLDNFLVNIRDPASLVILAPETLAQKAFLPVSIAGPHGLDLVQGTSHAFIACDGQAVVVLDIKTGREKSVVCIAGEPDVIWYNTIRQRLYCAVGKPGVIDVIDTQSLVLDEEIKTEEGAHTFAFDNIRQLLYAFLPQSCRVAIYEEM